MRPFRPRHTGADQAAYTLTATVPFLPNQSKSKTDKTNRASLASRE
ncbi:putative integrase domain protein [Mycobacterium ulcerans str. Harvey]|uniref:Integrase domain protein n=1 Tax=Mycobacterium ulcerans str. Harvey TaxID=1299332 RepID=A0ABN0R5Z1_MYCUL|nr:putative integrase domain protein [Mycobacterium ulcerans str. Harvey]